MWFDKPQELINYESFVVTAELKKKKVGGKFSLGEK
jgi:hypothetical protein